MCHRRKVELNQRGQPAASRISFEKMLRVHFIDDLLEGHDSCAIWCIMMTERHGLLFSFWMPCTPSCEGEPIQNCIGFPSLALERRVSTLLKHWYMLHYVLCSRWLARLHCVLISLSHLDWLIVVYERISGPEDRVKHRDRGAMVAKEAIPIESLRNRIFMNLIDL